jgi:hypothetical protein
MRPHQCKNEVHSKQRALVDPFFTSLSFNALVLNAREIHFGYLGVKPKPSNLTMLVFKAKASCSKHHLVRGS